MNYSHFLLSKKVRVYGMIVMLGLCFVVNAAEVGDVNDVNLPPDPLGESFVFFSGHSTLVTSGGASGEGFGSGSILGEFSLIVDVNSGIASFETVAAMVNMDPPLDLNEVFNLTQLQGVLTEPNVIEFSGVMPSDDAVAFEMTVVVSGDALQMTGEAIGSCCDRYDYHINAIARRNDFDDPNRAPASGGIYVWGEDKRGVVSMIPDGNDFVAVASGKFHCVALRSDGTLTAWGSDKDGKLEVPDGNDFVEIAAGSKHSIARRADGTIVVWGDDGLGQISDCPDSNDIIAIAAGDYHSLALRTDGSVLGWGGYNSYGEILPLTPAPDVNFIAISAGSYHSMALQSDGRVVIWGNDNHGQTRLPAGADDLIIQAVAARDRYSLMVSEDEDGVQKLVAWGNGEWLDESLQMPNYHYYLDDVEGTRYRSISAGIYHLMALTTDGRILQWTWPEGEDPYSWILSKQEVAYTDELVWPLSIKAGNEFSVVLGQGLFED